MADQNFNPLGTGEGESPVVPHEPSEKLDVTMRTSASDIKSMQDSGGQTPRSYVPPPPMPTYSPGGSSSGIGGQPFQAPQLDQYPPASMSQGQSSKFGEMPQEFPAPMPGAKKSGKGLFVAVLVVLILAGAGALGYFFVYPKFFKTNPVPVTEVPQTSVVPTLPEVPTVPGVPSPETAETIPNHVSLFKLTADLTLEVKLAMADLAQLKQSVPFDAAEVAVFKEIKLVNAEGNLLSLSGLMKFLIPDVFSADLLELFEPDFTMFTHTDNKGTWPGYVLRLVNDAILADAQTKAALIEGSANIKNFFLTDPGEASLWKSGVGNRYLTYSQNGAGLNYGWVGNNLLIATSYSGLQEATKRLQ